MKKEEATLRKYRKKMKEKKININILAKRKLPRASESWQRKQLAKLSLRRSSQRSVAPLLPSLCYLPRNAGAYQQLAKGSKLD